MRHGTIIAALFLLVATLAPAQEHAARGLVIAVDHDRRQLTVSCDAVPGYMAAMEMSFHVQDAPDLGAVKPGSLVRFIIVEHASALFAKSIQPVANFEPEPAKAGTLSALNSALNPTPTRPSVAIGEVVPDFTLTDQEGHAVSLSQFRGKVVALTFGYSRCPNPNYCLRLSRNLAALETQFHNSAGSDLVLLTIAIDPEYDQGPALARYAQSFGADAKSWHFLTGTVPQIHQVAAAFGMNFWNTGGTLTHTLHTVVINRQGRLAANIDGNQFTARQLGDLVKAMLDRPA